MGSNNQSFVSQNKKINRKTTRVGVFEVSPHAWRITNVQYADSELHFLTNNNQMDFAGMLHWGNKGHVALLSYHSIYYPRLVLRTHFLPSSQDSIFVVIFCQENDNVLVKLYGITT